MVLAFFPSFMCGLQLKPVQCLMLLSRNPLKLRNSFHSHSLKAVRWRIYLLNFKVQLQCFLLSLKVNDIRQRSYSWKQAGNNRSRTSQDVLARWCPKVEQSRKFTIKGMKILALESHLHWSCSIIGRDRYCQRSFSLETGKKVTWSLWLLGILFRCLKSGAVNWNLVS